MPVPMVAGNWKMNTNVKEAVQLATSIRGGMVGPKSNAGTGKGFG